MKIDQKELERRLASGNNIANTVVEHRSRAVGRRGPELPASVKDSIAVLAHEPGSRQKHLAAEFGVSVATIGNIKRDPTDAAQKEIDTNRKNIQDSALRKLMSSLNLISDDKLTDLSPKELTRVARDLSSIVGNLEEKQKETDQTQVNVIVYAPQTVEEKSYKTVEV
jgi:hypothetical protein